LQAQELELLQELRRSSNNQAMELLRQHSGGGTQTMNQIGINVLQAIMTSRPRTQVGELLPGACA
jgi:hypothetical protein